MTVKQDIFQKYRGALAFIEVRLPNGDISIGSAFHLGEGVYITAKHVIENNTILKIKTTEHYNIPNENGSTSIYGKKGKFDTVFPETLKIIEGPYLHEKENIDLATFKVDNEKNIYVELGGHFDDWTNSSDFQLFDVIVMGYPPIPFSSEPVLFAASGEINAVIDKYNAPHPHFIISTMPRGGFSGGLCLINNCVLGIIVESLTSNNKETELGYLSVLSIEPIFSFLKKLGILPRTQNYEWQ